MQKILNLSGKKNQVIGLKILGSRIPANNKFFDIMLVRNDEEQSVEVIESNVLDFGKVIEQLDQGNSVFITPKTASESQQRKKNREKRDITYYTHI
jgi:hypothetical protein